VLLPGLRAATGPDPLETAFHVALCSAFVKQVLGDKEYEKASRSFGKRAENEREVTGGRRWGASALQRLEPYLQGHVAVTTHFPPNTRSIAAAVSLRTDGST
jgi:hypothetical protein